MDKFYSALRSLACDATRAVKNTSLRCRPARTLVPPDDHVHPFPRRMLACESTRLRVLGVDPAVAGATGYGVVEFDGPAAAAAAVRRAETSRARNVRLAPPRNSPADRAARGRICSRRRRRGIGVHRAEYANGAETRRNARRGAAGCGAGPIPSHSYSPREVKASVAGYGGASKQQMQQMVSSLAGLSNFPEPADAADALAVALCHAHLSQARERLAASIGVRATAPFRATEPARLASQIEYDRRENCFSRLPRSSCLCCAARPRASLAAPASRAPAIPAAVATITFRKVFKSSYPEFVEIKVSEKERRRTTSASSTKTPIRARSTGRAAGAANFPVGSHAARFSGRRSRLHRRIANLGRKTFRYEKGSETHEVKFNYTLNDSATQLLDIFEGIARQESDLSTLKRVMKYDPLGVNDALLQIDTDYNNKVFPEPERLLGALDQVSADEKFIEIARQRARALASRIRNSH